MQGNFMPSPDRVQQSESKAAVRTIYIYELSKMNEVEGEAPLFSAVRKKLVVKVKTNSEGYFQVKLKPGKYSFFTLEEEDKFFANLFDGDGNINPVEVKEGEVTRCDININYRAAF